MYTFRFTSKHNPSSYLHLYYEYTHFLFYYSVYRMISSVILKVALMNLKLVHSISVCTNLLSVFITPVCTIVKMRKKKSCSLFTSSSSFIVTTSVGFAQSLPFLMISQHLLLLHQFLVYSLDLHILLNFSDLSSSMSIFLTQN